MWKCGQFHGEGIIIYSSADGTDCHYSGHWVEGKRQGKGQMNYMSGNIYKGEWKDNARNGYGIMSWINAKQEYRGEWLVWLSFIQQIE
jgi:hypothetical protein